MLDRPARLILRRMCELICEKCVSNSGAPSLPLPRMIWKRWKEESPPRNDSRTGFSSVFSGKLLTGQVHHLTALSSPPS